MNINSGGPHILLFERDQQLTALLTSEFQLAGYECHPARTAVEVFDAIARYPVRLVLVNLAQAAASRREFWVALDAQRRGRGVQVFTYRCMNIAGYGSDDSDEASRTVLTDMEIDGMLGVMNLVNAVRSRIPGPVTGSFSRTSAIPPAPSAGVLKRQADGGEPPVISQATAPLSTLSPNPAPGMPAANPAQPAPTESARANRPRNPPSGFSEKIRAVIYPSSRSFSPLPETSWVPHNPQGLASTPRVAGNAEENLPSSSAPAQGESGLAQLSRMVRERASDHGEADGASSRTREEPATPLAEPQDAQRARMADTATIGSLRASPIQDVPIEREQEYRSGGKPPGIASAAPASPAILPSSKTESSPLLSSPAESDVRDVEQEVTTEGQSENDFARALAEQPQQSAKQALSRSTLTDITSDDTLLNIVQSLPPMSSLPAPVQAQPPVLSGRATRSLGSVLLEGHLVPQERLEVAQHIQRMLRGVDMNYQLGEILLMFKLLTPDQLLAASLVSYGLITTAQISALGRIRQELHSIGLEYDLESLLVLFRMLSPEQLREVRASWTS
ncbi:MAG TPA: hypothetical protein VKB35_10695 [Ktedonobacteraceae bacterium]|nr:hypothetical protein [Ktedonobacteraceae bacterium]